jgi:hypothetical protein
VLEFSLTTDDLATFAAWQAKASGEADQRRGRLRLAGAWIVGTGAYLVAFAITTLPLLLGSQLGMAGVAEVVSVLVGGVAGWWEWRRGRVGERLLTRRYRAKARAALQSTGAARRIWPDEAGLNVAAGERTTHLPWTGITDVVETPTHVFILTGANAAHVVPRSADPAAVGQLAADVRVKLTH